MVTSLFKYIKTKTYDKVTQTYNYGYRDYSPTQARFKTVDPIKDGTNRMVYVNSDPINYIDLLGLDVEPADPRSPLERTLDEATQVWPTEES